MKRFNDTGLCIPQQHYMVDTAPKVRRVVRLVDFGEYFTINRPRQFGKTTTMFLLEQYLKRQDDYIVLAISFEGIDDATHEQSALFVQTFLTLLADQLAFQNLSELSQWVKDARPQTTTIDQLSRFITELVGQRPDHSWVLMIDEVDQSTNYVLFLKFLAMLRNKYLVRHQAKGQTFHSIILAGVHDIKTLKRKFRPDEKGSYNSPWNIAVDFKVDLSFNATEIETMLVDYADDKQIELDIPAIAERLYYYTSGYPYLVSKMCKFIDEDILPERDDQNWYLDDVERSFRMIADAGYTTTLFDSLANYLEGNADLYELVEQVVINGKSVRFAITDPAINLAHLYGIFSRSPQGYCQMHNRIFEQRLYDHILVRYEREDQNPVSWAVHSDYATPYQLNVREILRRFQAFMREHHSKRDGRFLERQGRLLFLSFLRPIMNGRGYEFKEPNVGDERRMDVVVTYLDQRYVIELKRWAGQAYHQRGLQQLSDYLDLYGLDTGYLLIYDFNKGKAYREEEIAFNGKQIFAVWV